MRETQNFLKKKNSTLALLKGLLPLLVMAAVLSGCSKDKDQTPPPPSPFSGIWVDEDAVSKYQAASGFRTNSHTLCEGFSVTKDNGKDIVLISATVIDEIGNAKTLDYIYADKKISYKNIGAVNASGEAFLPKEKPSGFADVIADAMVPDVEIHHKFSLKSKQLTQTNKISIGGDTVEEYDITLTQIDEKQLEALLTDAKACVSSKKDDSNPPPPSMIGKWIDTVDFELYKNSSRTQDKCAGFEVGITEDGRPLINLSVLSITSSGEYSSLGDLIKNSGYLYDLKGRINSAGDAVLTPEVLAELSLMPGETQKLKFSVNGRLLTSNTTVMAENEPTVEETQTLQPITDKDLKVVIEDAYKCLQTK